MFGALVLGLAVSLLVIFLWLPRGGAGRGGGGRGFTFVPCTAGRRRRAGVERVCARVDTGMGSGPALVQGVDKQEEVRERGRGAQTRYGSLTHSLRQTF